MNISYIKKISPYFLAAVVGALFLWLFMDGCKRKSPDHSADAAVLKEQARLRDSSHNAALRKDQQAKADSAKWKRVADSALTQLATARQLLGRSQAKTLELAGKVEQAKKDRDTAGYVTNCDGLAAEVHDLSEKVDRYEAANEALLIAKDSAEAAAQNRVREKDALYSQLWAANLALYKKYDQVLKDYNKASKRADKKYAIGIGGTAGITTLGTPGGAIGITVSRIIIPL